MGARTARLTRETSESSIDLALDLDGSGRSDIRTTVPFFDHLLTAFAKHALVDAGVSNPHSVQIPLFTRASLLRGRAGMVGLGKALIPSVHIDDCKLL